MLASIVHIFCPWVDGSAFLGVGSEAVGSGLGGGLTDGVGVGGIAVGDGGSGQVHGRNGGSVDIEGIAKSIVKHIESGFGMLMLLKIWRME